MSQDQRTRTPQRSMVCAYGKPSPWNAVQTCVTESKRPSGWCALCLHREYLALLAACKVFLTKPESDEAVDVNRDYTDTDAAIDQIRAAIQKAESQP